MTAEHLFNAVQRLLAGADHGFGESTDYDVVLDDGTRLPPKAVFGLAASEALGYDVIPGTSLAARAPLVAESLRAPITTSFPRGASTPLRLATNRLIPNGWRGARNCKLIFAASAPQASPSQRKLNFGGRMAACTVSAAVRTPYRNIRLRRPRPASKFTMHASISHTCRKDIARPWKTCIASVPTAIG